MVHFSQFRFAAACSPSSPQLVKTHSPQLLKVVHWCAWYVVHMSTLCFHVSDPLICLYVSLIFYKDFIFVLNMCTCTLVTLDLSVKPDLPWNSTVCVPMSSPPVSWKPLLNHFPLSDDRGYNIVPLLVPIKGFEVNLKLLFPCLQAAPPHRHFASNPSLECLLASNRVKHFRWRYMSNTLKLFSLSKETVNGTKSCFVYLCGLFHVCYSVSLTLSSCCTTC